MSVGKSNFYITLPSNSSFKYFKNNTTANYITQLPCRFELEGRWEVAVVEFHYPLTFYNVADKDETFIVVTWEGDVKKHFKIPPGDYTTSELLLEINKHKLIKKCVQFSNALGSERIECKKVKHDKTVEQLKGKDYDTLLLKDAITAKSIKMSPILSMQLGFDVDINFLAEENTVARRAPSPNIGLPSQIYIYCDVIENQYVGDTSAQLLRTIHVDKNKYAFGNQKVVIFDSPHYLEVSKTEFETIEIYLTNETGNSIPFAFGVSSVKLHFRKLQ